MQSTVLEAFGSILGAFGEQARPAHLRRMVAGWPPDGQILSGGVAWQAGGQQEEQKICVFCAPGGPGHRPADGRRMAGTCLGALLGRLGGGSRGK